jgi:hypothetical protein
MTALRNEHSGVHHLEESAMRAASDVSNEMLRSDPWSPNRGFISSSYPFSAPQARTPSTHLSCLEADEGSTGDSTITMRESKMGEGRPTNPTETQYWGWNLDESIYPLRPLTVLDIADCPMLDRFLSPEKQQDIDGKVEPQPFPSPMQVGSNMSRSTSDTSTHSGPAVCEVCGNVYEGAYGRGNLARHRRQKHGLSEQTFPCEDPTCRKVFKRPDARLKHYRREHPHLASSLFHTRKFGDTIKSLDPRSEEDEGVEPSNWKSNAPLITKAAQEFPPQAEDRPTGLGFPLFG